MLSLRNTTFRHQVLASVIVAFVLISMGLTPPCGVAQEGDSSSVRDAITNGSGGFNDQSNSITGRELNASARFEGNSVNHRATRAYEGYDPMQRPTGRISPQLNYLLTPPNGNNNNQSNNTEVTFPMLTRTAVWQVDQPERQDDGYALKYTDVSGNGADAQENSGKTVKYKGTDYKSRTLSTMNLSVDDDIFKAQMFYFQAIADMEKAYMGKSENGTQTGELNTFLNVANTAFGVGNMSLGFLDKTAGSSMASSQMMADINIMAHLMKQVSYQTYLYNHPNRGSIFEMTDEKFEKCMFDRQAEKNNNGTGSSVPTGFSLEHVDFSDCTDCGDAKTKAPYAYCSCCADKSLRVNKSINGSSNDQGGNTKSRLGKRLCDSYLTQLKQQGGLEEDYDADYTYSLVEKAFLGVRGDNKPLSIDGTNNNTNTNDGKDTLRQYAYNFQDLYGDYCFYQDSAKKAIKMRYVYPLYSVQQQILFIRNGGDSDKMLGKNSKNGGEQLAYCTPGVGILDHCPKNEKGKVPGICPTLRTFIELVRDNKYEDTYKEHPDTMDDYWRIATLGSPLSVSDIVNIKQLGDPPHYVSPYQDRYIETYCDAASTTAFKRVHSRMASIMQDYMAMNTRLTEQEKRLLQSLVKLPTDQLNSSLRESQANLELTISAAQEAARKNEAKRGSIMASSRALYALVQQSSEITDFGK